MNFMIYILYNFDDKKLIYGLNIIFTEMGFSVLMDRTIQVMNEEATEEKRYKISRCKAVVCVNTGELPKWGA